MRRPSRGFADLAALRSISGGNDVQLPDPLAVNMAKYHFAHGFHAATATLIDLAGGLVATGPGGDDWADPQTRRVLAKYFAAAAPAEERLRLIHPIGDICTRPVGRLPVGPWRHTPKDHSRPRSCRSPAPSTPRGPAPRWRRSCARPQRLTNATRSGSNRRAVPTEPRRLPTGGWSESFACRARRTGPDRAYFTISSQSTHASRVGPLISAPGPMLGRRQLLLRVLR